MLLKFRLLNPTLALLNPTLWDRTQESGHSESSMADFLPGHKQHLENTALITKNNLPSSLPWPGEAFLTGPAASQEFALSFTPVCIPRWRSLGHSSVFFPGSSSSPSSGSVPSSLLTCPWTDFTARLLGTADSSHNQQPSKSLPPASLPGPAQVLSL